MTPSAAEGKHWSHARCSSDDGRCLFLALSKVHGCKQSQEEAPANPAGCEADIVDLEPN